MIHNQIDSIFNDLISSLAAEDKSRSSIERHVSQINTALRPLMLSLAKLQSSVPYIVDDFIDGQETSDEKNEDDDDEGLEYMGKIVNKELELAELQKALKEMVEINVGKDERLEGLVNSKPKARKTKNSGKKEDEESFLAYHKYQSMWTDTIQQCIQIVLMKHFIKTCMDALEPLYSKGKTSTKSRKTSKGKKVTESASLSVSLAKLDYSALSQLLATPEQVSEMLGVPFSHLYSEYVTSLISDADTSSLDRNKLPKKPSLVESSAALKDATLFHLSVPNYLHAVLSVCSILSRLAFNCVTTVSQIERIVEELVNEDKRKPLKNGKRTEPDDTDDESNQLFHKSHDKKGKGKSDKLAKSDQNSENLITRPSPYFFSVVIASFLKQVQSGFMSLDFKNDSLRRHMDVLKYEVKNAEQVVYDLSLRGLI